MLHRIVCVRALLLLCIFTIVPTCPAQTAAPMASEYDSCEDTTRFLLTLKSKPPLTAMLMLTLPMANNNIPPEIRNIQQKLLSSIYSGALSMERILRDISAVKNHNRYDLLITTLMILSENYSWDCTMEEDMKKALIYFLKRKYLNKNELNASGRFGRCLPGLSRNKKSYPLSNNSPTSVPFKTFGSFNRASFTNQINFGKCRRCRLPCSGKLGHDQQSDHYHEDSHPHQDIQVSHDQLYGHYHEDGHPHEEDCTPCNNQKALLETMLKRISALEQLLAIRFDSNRPQLSAPIPSVPSVRSVPSVSSVSSVPSVKSVIIPIVPTQIVQKPQIDIDNLMKLIPLPKYEKEKVMYNKFKDLLKNEKVQKLIQSLDLTKYKNYTDILEIIITTVLHNVTITEEIHEVFSFYSSFKEAGVMNFNFAILTDVLPLAKDQNELVYYNLIKNLLRSKEIYNMINVQELNSASDLSQKLLIVLRQITQKTVPTNLQEAINYYLAIVNGRLSKINFSELATLLPPPQGQGELVKFNTFKNFLESNYIYILMKNVNFTTVTSKQELFRLILKELILNSQDSMSEIAKYYRDILILQQFGYNYFSLLNLIPNIQENVNYLRMIENYMYSMEFENILKTVNLKTLPDYDKLIQILQIIQSKSSNKIVLEASLFILQKIQEEQFYKTMGGLLLLLPPPKNDDEKRKADIVIKYLHSGNAYKLLQNLDVSLFPDNKFLYEFILRTVVESTEPPEIREAFKYYLESSEKLERLDFVTIKEVKKKFPLNEIFTDTLDLRSLTIPQKEAFRNFFKYLSEPATLSQFDSWDQAKTRWEFVKTLFKYFLEKHIAPPHILESIKVLDPLLKRNGKAALPP